MWIPRVNKCRRILTRLIWRGTTINIISSRCTSPTHLILIRSISDMDEWESQGTRSWEILTSIHVSNSIKSYTKQRPRVVILTPRLSWKPALVPLRKVKMEQLQVLHQRILLSSLPNWTKISRILSSLSMIRTWWRRLCKPPAMTPKSCHLVISPKIRSSRATNSSKKSRRCSPSVREMSNKRREPNFLGCLQAFTLMSHMISDDKMPWILSSILKPSWKQRLTWSVIYPISKLLSKSLKW